MGAISDRLTQIIANAGDLAPLERPIKERLEAGNREMILAGKSPDGSSVAPVKPATLKGRVGPGPPRAPRGSASRVIKDYVVAVVTEGGRLKAHGSWPTFAQAIAALDQGTKRMAARPTMGFRREDLEWCRARLREHVLRKGR